MRSLPRHPHAGNVRVPSADAVMIERDGCAVAAHYGSVATEVAVCVKRAGIAERSDLGRLELRGRDAWIEHLLAKAIGDRVPEAGAATRVGDTWCCRVTAERTVVIGPHGALARWRRIAREAIVAGSAVGCADLAADFEAVSLVGPRAGQVLAAAGVPHDLELCEVRTATLAGAPAVVVRAAAERYLLLVVAAADPWRELLAAGRPLGLAPVGCEALERLAAATRPLG